MGIYVNPGNSGFAEIVNSDYEDKTVLEELVNQTIRKTNKLTCVSRPRRFGKSYAAKMLYAYYDCSCDSYDLFSKRKISRSKSFRTHLNRYNVIYLDITGFISAAYMTGILPIKKDGAQSAISDFREYSILNPGKFAEFTGFTESEVCRSFWRETSAAESLRTYINMDFDGMQEIISRLIAGEEIEVDSGSFQNDFETFKSRDDILTLLVHLGYLTYRKSDQTVRIPNEEVRSEFRRL